MELCVDNPREGFADLFATHPSVQSRIDKLVAFAGGRDPGPLEHVGADEPASEPEDADPAAPPPLPNKGPWSDAGVPSAVPPLGGQGPWGPHR
jgi:heat shock protein HtpX